MKKLFALTVLLSVNLFAQGVDYYKQQAKRSPVEAMIMIDHDTLSNAQMDNLRETLKTLQEKYHLDARLVIRRYDKNASLESYNYKAMGKPFYLIFDTVYEDYSAKKAWVKDVKRAIKYTREEAIVELNRRNDMKTIWKVVLGIAILILTAIGVYVYAIINGIKNLH